MGEKERARGHVTRCCYLFCNGAKEQMRGNAQQGRRPGGREGGPKFPLGYNTSTYDSHENVVLEGKEEGD